ncbi:MAG: SRPBCC family protein [Pseudomonadota bacterium]
MSAQPAIEKVYVFPHSVGEVYAAWVSSATVIAPATRMEVRAEVGGPYRLYMDIGDDEIYCAGTFSVVEPQTRIVYTWQWQGEDERTTITVGFAEHPDGCAVALHHDGFQTAASHARHAQGWERYAAGFAAHLQG